MSALLYACKKGKYSYVKKFLSYNYNYENDKIFNWKKEINRRGGIEKNTCLHFIALRSNI